MRLQLLTQRNEKAMASSEKTAKAVFKVNAARGLKARDRVSKKESKVTPSMQSCSQNVQRKQLV